MAKKNYKKENAKALEKKKHELIKTICDDESDMDIETFNQEVSKVEKINGLISNDKKPKMGDQSRAALIKGCFGVALFLGGLAYETRNVWSNKTAESYKKYI